MLTKDDFIRHILGEAPRTKARATKKDTGHIEGFDFADDAPESEATEDTRFVTPLLQAGFGDGQGIPRATVIRSTDAVAKYIPDEVRYWPKTPTRPHHTLLIEANLTHRELLAIPAFKSRQLAHLDIAEDAVARLVAEALEGFQRGAEGLDASALKGQKHETLCVVSIIDEREGHAGRLVCFGTFNAKTEGLETFFLTEHARTWDRADARERLGLIYERQFKKLGEASWQEAFTTTDERKQAEKLLEVCTKKNVLEKDVQESILDLLDTIARGFGLRKKADAERRLRAFPLPGEHDIGIDSEEREKEYGGTNPFSGVTLRDDDSRLLGYIVYPLKTKAQAEKLRQHLEKHNRFHNVLVVYPDANQASIELWQGREQLTGKLRKGQSHKDAADVVNLLSRFFVVSKAKVRNPTELAQELAYRARYLRRLALRQLEDEPEKGALRTLYAEFRKALVHDLTEPDFADAFAQTLTYSLLTARWVLSAQNDASSERFSRKEAMKRLSLGSRFLAEMFAAVLSMKLDDRGRLLWLVDDVADLLDRIDIEAVFKPDGTDLTADPIVHFYEPFLAAYDAKIRMQRGAFYTPQPVVSYIVRSVHELLQTEFGLADGLADTTTWGEMLKKHPGLKLPPLTDEPGEKRTISPDEPFVQILDPATGTATFLVEVIDVIHRTLAAKWKQQRLTDAQQRAAWNDYVPQHLLPRLHAFELMMAPYAIAHMKIGLKLAETGYRFGTEERARIYLTNALESWVKQLPLIGFDALAHEAAAVNEIKRHKRFTVVIGNPPYSHRANLLSPEQRAIIEPYKFINGERMRVRGALQLERNLNDDYVKFVRFSQTLVDQVGVGAVGLITNNAYLENLTFPGMRNSLAATFSVIRIVNLNGSVKTGGTTPDGGKDENVFDIQQGVAISILSRPLLPVASERRYCNLWGLRSEKEHILRQVPQTLSFLDFTPTPDNYLFVPAGGESVADYLKWKALDTIFGAFGTGIMTNRNGLTIGMTSSELDAAIALFLDRRLDDQTVSERLEVKSNAIWDLHAARVEIAKLKPHDFFRPIDFRPFDTRTIFYHSAAVDNMRRSVMDAAQRTGNLTLVVSRQQFRQGFQHALVTRKMFDECFLSAASREKASGFSLLVGPGETGGLALSGDEANLKCSFLPVLGTSARPSIATDKFQYIYAILHSETYRARFAEELKRGYPRIPETTDPALADALARLGGELTALHLLESPRLDQPVTEFIGSRNPEVEKVTWTRDTVWVDKAQTTGFRGVREPVWNFHIGGYQVCEKWLKDRKGRTLTKDDLAHYHKIVVALSETIRLMKEIDQVIEQHGGWPGAFATKASAS